MTRRSLLGRESQAVGTSDDPGVIGDPPASDTNDSYVDQETRSPLLSDFSIASFFKPKPRVVSTVVTTTAKILFSLQNDIEDIRNDFEHRLVSEPLYPMNIDPLHRENFHTMLWTLMILGGTSPPANRHQPRFAQAIPKIHAFPVIAAEIS